MKPNPSANLTAFLADRLRSFGLVVAIGFRESRTLLRIGHDAHAPRSVDVIALDQALTELAVLDRTQSRVVELHFFGGLSFDEVASVLDVSASTVYRRWRTARLWLLKRLSGGRVDAERWKLIKALVDGALDQPPEHREAWLAHACVNTPDLVPDVRTLLDAAAYTGGFLETVATDRSGPAPLATTPRDCRGTHIAHDELLEWIGAGGMGDVFRASDLALGRDAALKVLPRQFDQDLRHQLLREAEASAKLQHPAIATFYEAGVPMVKRTSHGIRSGPHASRATRQRSLGARPSARHDAVCLVEALAHAHAAGRLHRDIKPENVILTGIATAKLLDFSIALPLTTTADTRHTPPQPTGPSGTARGRLVGTLGYLAPEQVRGDP